MSKLRLGFIGAGGMADAHLKGLTDGSRFPDVEIAAFCDVVLERAQAQAAKYGAASFDLPKTMVQNAGLDACYILLPPFAHGDAERACIEGGVPFLVEKPIGNDRGLLKELKQEVETKGLLTCAGYMNRYQPSVRRAKEAFSSDEAVLAVGGWIGATPVLPKDREPAPILRWWVVKEKSGGQMVEQVTHTVDLVRYFLGEAVEVYAHTTTAFNKKRADLMPGYTMDDAMTTTIKFQNGALATILSSAATPQAKSVGPSVFLDVHGTHTSARFTGWGHEATIAREGSDVETVASAGEIFPIEDRAFLDAVKTGDKAKVLTDYADAYQTAVLTLAMNESAATNKPVELGSFA